MIVVLTGGTGGAKFVRGLARAVAPERLAIVVNTGDDLDWWGLRVCPDIDTITYCLAGLLDTARGWGVAGDSFVCRDRIGRFGEATWFNVGDKDLALHLHRTRLLRDGLPLTDVTRRIADGLGVRSAVLPMSDQTVRTIVRTPEGDLPFQEFFVRDRFEADVTGVTFRNDGDVRAGPAVIETIMRADAVIIGPSNPITSIGPILSVPEVRRALASCTGPVLAVSPIVGGAAVSGPAGKLMRACGFDVSAAGVAGVYREFLDVLVADERDADQRETIQSMGMSAGFTDTLMRDDAAAERLARTVLEQAAARSEAR